MCRRAAFALIYRYANGIKGETWNIRLISRVLLLLFFLIGSRSSAQPLYQLYGVNFSPYLDGQSPGTQITVTQIQARLALIAPYTKWVRTYSSLNGLEQVCPVAHQLGLKCAAGASIYGSSTDAQEVASLTTLMRQGFVDLAIVGTEALFRNNVSDSTLVAYMQQVKAAAPSVPVSTADTYTALLDHPAVLAAGDVVLVNIYPFFEGVYLENAVSWVNGWYQLLTNAVGGKQIIISETGWPSGGARIGSAVPSSSSASFYFLNFVSWARAYNVPYFYFEAFDETWKGSENSQGPYFGLFDKGGHLKPGMTAVFNGNTIPNNWGGELIDGVGTPSLRLTYVPVYGSAEHLSGRISHFRPADYKMACYIYAGGSWYVKPYGSRPLTPIFADGTWSCSLGQDIFESKVAAFAVPNSVNPPWPLQDPPTPILQLSVASEIVARSTIGLSGSVQDGAGRGLAGITVLLGGSQAQIAQTDFEGKFSFYDLMAGGSYSVTPSSPTITFTPANRSMLNITGAQSVGGFLARLISRVAIFRSGYFWLEDVDGNQQFNAPPDRAFAFGGVPGDIPISGDWNGSGTMKVGVYRPSNGLFVLDYNGDGQFTTADTAYNLGQKYTWLTKPDTL